MHTFEPNISLIRLFSLMLNYAKPRSGRYPGIMHCKPVFAKGVGPWSSQIIILYINNLFIFVIIILTVKIISDKFNNTK